MKLSLTKHGDQVQCASSFFAFSEYHASLAITFHVRNKCGCKELNLGRKRVVERSSLVAVSRVPSLSMVARPVIQCSESMRFIYQFSPSLSISLSQTHTFVVKMNKKATLTSINLQANRRKVSMKKRINRGSYFPPPRKGEIKRRIFSSFVNVMKKITSKCICIFSFSAAISTKP